jgi:hypothetical protein
MFARPKGFKPEGLSAFRPLMFALTRTNSSRRSTTLRRPGRIAEIQLGHYPPSVVSLITILAEASNDDEDEDDEAAN